MADSVKIQLKLMRQLNVTLISIFLNFCATSYCIGLPAGSSEEFVQSAFEKVKGAHAVEGAVSHSSPPALGTSIVAGLRLRKAPNLDSPIIDSLAEGELLKLIDVSSTTITVDGKNGPFYFVQTCNGVRGWSFSGYIKTPILDGYRREDITYLEATQLQVKHVGEGHYGGPQYSIYVDHVADIINGKYKGKRLLRIRVESNEMDGWFEVGAWGKRMYLIDGDTRILLTRISAPVSDDELAEIGVGTKDANFTIPVFEGDISWPFEGVPGEIVWVRYATLESLEWIHYTTIIEPLEGKSIRPCQAHPLVTEICDYDNGFHVAISPDGAHLFCQRILVEPVTFFDGRHLLAEDYTSETVSDDFKFETPLGARPGDLCIDPPIPKENLILSGKTVSGRDVYLLNSSSHPYALQNYKKDVPGGLHVELFEWWEKVPFYFVKDNNGRLIQFSRIEWFKWVINEGLEIR